MKTSRYQKKLVTSHLPLRNFWPEGLEMKVLARWPVWGELSISKSVQFLDTCNHNFSKRFVTWNDTYKNTFSLEFLVLLNQLEFLVLLNQVEFLVLLNQRSTCFLSLDKLSVFSDVRHVWVSLCHALVVQVPDSWSRLKLHFQLVKHRPNSTGAGYSYTMHAFFSK